MLEMFGTHLTVYPNQGLRASDFPAPWTMPAGVYDVPIKLPGRHRLIVAVTDMGELLHAAVVEPGGDINLATSDLTARLPREHAVEVRQPLVHL